MDKAVQLQTDKDQRGLLFAAVAGLFFFITLLKFGNPVVLDAQVAPPENLLEAIYGAWQIKWGYLCFVPVLVIGIFSIRRQDVGWRSTSLWFKWLFVLPTCWLIWQFISATQTVDSALTTATLKHFTVCVVLFYLGFFALRQMRNPWPVWLFLSVALLWIVRVGWDQHFGGLEQTRKFFYSDPNWREATPEFLKKLASNRIYSTLFYPNTLAGAILLLLPITLGFIWQSTAKLRDRARWVIVVLIAIPALACLIWSGSKAGWLIALVVGLIALGQSNLRRRTKLAILGAVLVCGLVGFGVRYAKFFERGSTSVVARFDYWRATLIIARGHPVFGLGPGTFGTGYSKVKKPESEMARLAHNDYLEQLSDSGMVGFILFSGFIFGVLIFLYRYRTKIWRFALLSVTGVLLHQFVEFHLYIPALAWPTFFLLGWLLSNATRSKMTVS